MGLNYYRHFPGDYLRDTLHLSAAEDGMYRRLLDLAYTTEKPLPLDRRLIYRLTRCRCIADRRAIDRVIDEFFNRTRWGYIHKRVQEEINRAESRIKAARQNGASGGRPKKAETQEKPSGLSSANPGKSSPDSRLQTPDPETDQVSPNPTLMQKLGVSLSLWTSYKRVREKLHRPIVSGAEDLVFAELLAFQQTGEDPIEILEQAVRTSSWKLCPIKNGVQSHESFEQQKRRREEKALSEVREGADRVLQQVEDRVPDTRSLKSPDGSLPRSIGKSVGK